MKIIPFTQNVTNFGAKNTKKPTAQYPQPNYNSKYDDKTLLGAAVASACLGIASANVYNDYQNKQLVKDMMYEYKQDDTKSLKIEDLNKDNTPEIIIEKKDGAKVVYDIKNNQVNFDFDGEQIEKIR